MHKPLGESRQNVAVSKWGFRKSDIAILLLGAWGRCHHPPDYHGPLIGRQGDGRQSDGSFQTAKAKIYPTGLKEILGTAIFQFALQLIDCAIDHQLPPEFEPYLEQSFHATIVQCNLTTMAHDVFFPHGGSWLCTKDATAFSPCSVYRNARHQLPKG